jgi:flagellar hook assembly protein FlgD
VTPTGTPTRTWTITLSPTSTPSVATTRTFTRTPTPADVFWVSDNLFKSGGGNTFIVHYKVQNPGKYSLKIYNSAGELVRTLKQLQSKWPVQDDVPWDGKNMKNEYVASGIYVVYFESSRYVRIAKVIVLH